MDFKNKKINLFGTVYSIKYVDKVEVDKAEVYGLTDSTNRTILIAKTINGVKVPLNELEITLLHELTHAILMTGQYMEYNNDEPLVEWIARCIYQLIKKNII